MRGLDSQGLHSPIIPSLLKRDGVNRAASDLGMLDIERA